MGFLVKLIFQLLKAITLIALCGLAIFLTYEIFLKFQSKDSSFKKSQVPISTLPSMSICFDPKNKNLLEYGKDFNISKYNNNADYLGIVYFLVLISKEYGFYHLSTFKTDMILSTLLISVSPKFQKLVIVLNWYVLTKPFSLSWQHKRKNP